MKSIFQLDFVYETQYCSDEQEKTIRVVASSYENAYTLGRNKLGYEIERVISVTISQHDEVDEVDDD